MKHTDFDKKRREITHLEQAELIKALQAHGGSFEWNEDTELDHPIIAVNTNGCCPEPTDIEVTKVSTENGVLIIEGVKNSTGEEVDFDIEGIFDGQLSNIIDYIPAINGIDDVTTTVKE